MQFIVRSHCKLMLPLSTKSDGLVESATQLGGRAWGLTGGEANTAHAVRQLHWWWLYWAPQVSFGMARAFITGQVQAQQAAGRYRVAPLPGGRDGAGWKG